MRPIAKWTRLALIALSSCALGASGMARADAPAGGAIPPGWVWQGVWQDGRWNGQWIPGPGVMPGTTPGVAPWGGDPDAMRMADRCHEHHHDRECEALIHDHPDFAPGYRPAPPPYPPMPYGPMAYAPVAYMMVPVVTAPQQPCVETRTVTTTTYITEKHRRVIWTRPAPHHKDKRVYTGS